MRLLLLLALAIAADAGDVLAQSADLGVSASVTTSEQSCFGRAAPCRELVDLSQSHDREVVERRWYGWELLAADVALAGAFVGLIAASSPDRDLGPQLALGGLVLAGPAIHVAHARPGRAATSLLLRVGAPLAGAYLASTACRDSLLDCGSHRPGAGYLGLMLGGIGALTFDAIRSHDEVVERRSLAPALFGDGTAGGLGLAGTF